MKNWIKKELQDYKILFRNIPAAVVAFFVVSVVGMNLLANKEIINFKYLALDAGFALSWVSFLCMDCICKRYGAKAATKISIFAILTNLALTGIFKLMTLTPGMWGEFYTTGSLDVNTALNATIGGTWYVVFGSALAMFIASVMNSVLNVAIGKATTLKGYKAFALRSFVSTGLSQLTDNLVFATVVSKVFFGWTWTQVIICSLTAAVFELLMEVFFSGFGYKMSKAWEEENVGKEYLDYVAKSN